MCSCHPSFPRARWTILGWLAACALAASAAFGDAYTVYYVTPDGTGGGGDGPVFASVQAAVDAADEPSDVIKIAEGTYAGVSVRDGTTQTVHIAKTLTAQGGYQPPDWTTPHPATHPTILDAQGAGRVLVITGGAGVVIAGIEITGGDATGAAGAYAGADAGGGVFANNASLELRDCVVRRNHAPGSGGGVCAELSALTLDGNIITSNTAGRDGGGLFAYGWWQSPASYPVVLRNNRFDENHSSAYGGGVALSACAASLEQNTFTSNHAGQYGGGLNFASCNGLKLEDSQFQDNEATNGGAVACAHSQAAMIARCEFLGNAAVIHGGGVYSSFCGMTVEDSHFEANSAGDGGGMSLWWTTAGLRRNRIIANQALNAGGGVFLRSGGELDNNVIAGNRLTASTGPGAGVYIENAPVTFRHNTVAGNSGGDGVGVDLRDDRGTSLINNIIAGHAAGIRGVKRISGQTLIDGVLWFGNTDNTSGTLDMTVTHEKTGDPLFVDAAGGDYHIGAGSAAEDAGVILQEIDEDMDGDLRPMGGRPDLGEIGRASCRERV